MALPPTEINIDLKLGLGLSTCQLIRYSPSPPEDVGALTSAKENIHCYDDFMKLDSSDARINNFLGLLFVILTLLDQVGYCQRSNERPKPVCLPVFLRWNRVLNGVISVRNKHVDLAAGSTWYRAVFWARGTVPDGKGTGSIRCFQQKCGLWAAQSQWS